MPDVCFSMLFPETVWPGQGLLLTLEASLHSGVGFCSFLLSSSKINRILQMDFQREETVKKKKICVCVYTSMHMCMHVCAYVYSFCCLFLLKARREME